MLPACLEKYQARCLAYIMASKMLDLHNSKQDASSLLIQRGDK
jgi:hypothetical protein